jgi:hypothetical protein
MTVERFPYRAKKWAIQQITKYTKRPDQHQRLNETDFDALVILDACRWDVLNDVTEWPFGKARSPGSQTAQWLGVAEETGIFEDTHIVSGQGQYERRSLGEASIDKIWEDEFVPRLGTVLPTPVLERAEERLYAGNTPTVIHLVPPHAPYIAKVGDEWLLTEPSVNIWKRPRDGDADGTLLSPQVAMARGYVDIPRAREGYRASVKSTWEVVEEYVGRWVCDGHTVVVTADHGEALGRLREFGLYAHPSGCHIQPLTEVPFEVFEPGENPHSTPETTEEKLAALGYVEMVNDDNGD